MDYIINEKTIKNLKIDSDYCNSFTSNYTKEIIDKNKKHFIKFVFDEYYKQIKEYYKENQYYPYSNDVAYDKLDEYIDTKIFEKMPTTKNVPYDIKNIIYYNSHCK